MTDTPYAPKADTRDLRDPQKLGEMMAVGEFRIAGQTLSEYYDRHKSIFKYECPNYPQDESLATVTAREYRQELLEAAESGDRYAINLLQEKGWSDAAE